jgi:hypothetical protein
VALTGTLKDFGIAEILQLIGQQAKSGVLHLKSKDEQIHIAMADGCVVHAECTGRKAKDRLGNMLVRADLITPKDLEAALEEQKRSLRRLGDVLVSMGTVTENHLREMAALQTTETVYKLFAWKSGTYAFEPGAVEYDKASATLLRAESVLMEGFRQLDEWPLIRKKITSSAMTFERLRSLPLEGPGGAKDDVDAAFEGLGDGDGDGKGKGKGEFANLGPNERKVFGLAEPNVQVSKIVDVSRLGEFEACKALLNLVNLGCLGAIAAPKGKAPAVGAYARDWSLRLRQGAARLLGTVAIAAALAGLVYWVAERGSSWGDPGAVRPFQDLTAQRFLARYQLARLSGAIEVYRLERGDYPPDLGALVEAGLASPRDIRYPWTKDYYYRKKEGGFVLLEPVE